MVRCFWGFGYCLCLRVLVILLGFGFRWVCLFCCFGILWLFGSCWLFDVVYGLGVFVIGVIWILGLMILVTCVV